MKLEIEVPEIACYRCGKVAAMLPTALKRTSGGGDVTDSAGNDWQAQGAQVPAGWTRAPTPEADKPLCPECSAIVAAGISALLQMPAPQLPARTAAASIPAHAPPPVVGRVVSATPTPAQASARVTGGARIYSNPVMRPEPVVSASPVLVQPPSVSSPIAPAAPKYAPTAPQVLAGPPTVRAPITPAEKGSNMIVRSNTQYPQPLVRSAAPAPLRSEVPRAREVAVQGNEEVDPQGPVTTTAIIRGAGV